MIKLVLELSASMF